MKTVTVKKEVLLKKLLENKKIHIREYNEAMIGWVETAIKQLENEIETLKTNPLSSKLYFNLSKPVSYEKKYDVAIGMLEMEVNDIVEISSEEFQRYVNDEWEWTESFKHMSTFYNNRS